MGFVRSKVEAIRLFPPAAWRRIYWACELGQGVSQMKRWLLSVLSIVLLATPCQAALFSGPSFFSSAPFSQIGPVTNNLVLTDSLTGFVVSGQLLVNTPPGNVGGVLAQWTVDRPLDPTFGSGPAMTTTVLDGFVLPPVGAFQPTTGNVQSFFTNFQLPSTSLIPITLTNGAATWNNIVVNSTSFPYSSGGTNYLRQQFFVDGVQLAGPGGTWTIDVPITTEITLLFAPEPGSGLLLLAGLGCLALRSRRKISRA
jgi:hypothetical protein